MFKVSMQGHFDFPHKVVWGHSGKKGGTFGRPNSNAETFWSEDI